MQYRMRCHSRCKWFQPFSDYWPSNFSSIIPIPFLSHIQYCCYLAQKNAEVLILSELYHFSVRCLHVVLWSRQMCPSRNRKSSSSRLMHPIIQVLSEENKRVSWWETCEYYDHHYVWITVTNRSMFHGLSLSLFHVQLHPVFDYICQFQCFPLLWSIEDTLPVPALVSRMSLDHPSSGPIPSLAALPFPAEFRRPGSGSSSTLVIFLSKYSVGAHCIAREK